MLAFAEGLVLAERAGVDRTRAVEVMTRSPIGLRDRTRTRHPCSRHR
jgi:3-hydroxyisobutyrate dehydrogenase-like beta-hydroxyacid dehydrogenase